MLSYLWGIIKTKQMRNPVIVSFISFILSIALLVLSPQGDTFLVEYAAGAAGIAFVWFIVSVWYDVKANRA